MDCPAADRRKKDRGHSWRSALEVNRTEIEHCQNCGEVRLSYGDGGGERWYLERVRVTLVPGRRA